MADSDGADIEITTLRQDMANETVQLKATFRKTVSDSVDITCRPNIGGRTDGDSTDGVHPGACTVGAPLPGPSSPSTALLGQQPGSLVPGPPPSLTGGPDGIGATGQPFGSHDVDAFPLISVLAGPAVGALLPTSSLAHPLAEGFLAPTPVSSDRRALWARGGGQLDTAVSEWRWSHWRPLSTGRWACHGPEGRG